LIAADFLRCADTLSRIIEIDTGPGRYPHCLFWNPRKSPDWYCGSDMLYYLPYHCLYWLVNAVLSVDENHTKSGDEDRWDCWSYRALDLGEGCDALPKWSDRWFDDGRRDGCGQDLKLSLRVRIAGDAGWARFPIWLWAQTRERTFGRLDRSKR
jgi:hypothetical protein